MNDGKYCPSCDEANPNAAKFCLKCGKQFDDSSVSSMSPHMRPHYDSIKPSRPPRRFTKRYVLYGVIGLFVMLMVIGAAFASSPFSSTPSNHAASTAPSESPTVSVPIDTPITPTSADITPTPAPTVTPVPRSLPDYSTYLDKVWTTPESTVVQPFIRSTNERGNDVYTGVMQNTAHPHRQFTVVTEFPSSKDQTMELYNKYITDKTREGFAARPDIVAQWKAKYDYVQGPNANLWVGQRGSQEFYVWTQYVTGGVNAWELIVETLN